MKIPIRSVYGQTYCHESEDIEKVKRAFEVFFPKKEIKQKIQSGAYSTKIKIVYAEVKGKKARDLVKKILDRISKLEKNKILNELRLRLSEEGKFYLRFNKQIAYEKGKITLTDEEDSIQIIFSIESYPSNYATYLKILKELFS